MPTGFHTSSLNAVKWSSFRHGLPGYCLAFDSVRVHPFPVPSIASDLSFFCKDSWILFLVLISLIMALEEKAERANKRKFCKSSLFTGIGKLMAVHGHSREGATMVDKTRCEPILVLLSGCNIAKRSWWNKASGNAWDMHNQFPVIIFKAKITSSNSVGMPGTCLLMVWWLVDRSCNLWCTINRWNCWSCDGSSMREILKNYPNHVKNRTNIPNLLSEMSNLKISMMRTMGS